MIRPSIIALSARTAALCLPKAGALYRVPEPASWRLSALTGDGDVREGAATTVVSVFHDLQPGGRYRLEVEGFQSLEFETAACAGLIDPTAFGLV